MHSVEVSEAHDARQFLTFWCKGQKPGRTWAARHGLPDRHDPAIYHVGPGNYGWLPGMFPGKESQGWSTHYHLDLPGAPSWADLEPYLDAIPTTIQAEVREYLNGRPA